MYSRIFLISDLNQCVNTEYCTECTFWGQRTSILMDLLHIPRRLLIYWQNKNSAIFFVWLASREILLQHGQCAYFYQDIKQNWKFRVIYTGFRRQVRGIDLLLFQLNWRDVLEKSISSNTKIEGQIKKLLDMIFRLRAKLYTPSTLNIDLIIQWHTQLNVCAVKCL